MSADEASAPRGLRGSALKCFPSPAAWFRGSAPPPGGRPRRPGRGAAASELGGSRGHDGGQLSIASPEAQKEGKAHGPRPRGVPGTEHVLYIGGVTSSLQGDAFTPAAQRRHCHHTAVTCSWSHRT